MAASHNLTVQPGTSTLYDDTEVYDSHGHNTEEHTREQDNGSADFSEDDTYSEFDAEGDYGKIVMHTINKNLAAPDNDVTLIHTHAFTYDDEGRMTSQVNTDEHGTVLYTLHIAYDDVASTETRTSTGTIRNAAGATVPYTDVTSDRYDSAHEWLSETANYAIQGEAPQVYVTVNTWAGGRQLTSVTTVNGSPESSERYLYACPAGWQTSTATASTSPVAHRRIAHARTDVLRHAAR